MNIGGKIKNRRKELGMSAEDLAAKLNISPSTVYRYENSDISNMGIDKLALIAQALHVSSSYLMNFTDDFDPLPCCSLSSSEEDLLSMFRELNEEGQNALLEYCEFILSKNEYKKNSDVRENA